MDAQQKVGSRVLAPHQLAGAPGSAIGGRCPESLCYKSLVLTYQTPYPSSPVQRRYNKDDADETVPVVTPPTLRVHIIPRNVNKVPFVTAASTPPEEMVEVRL